MNNSIISDLTPSDNWFEYINNEPDINNWNAFNGYPNLIYAIFCKVSYYINTNYTHIIFTELDFKQRHTVYIWLYNMNTKFFKTIINNKRAISVEIDEEAWVVTPEIAAFSNQFSTYTYIDNFSLVFNIYLIYKYPTSSKIDIKHEIVDMINSIKNSIDNDIYNNIIDILNTF
jgi:hypothetical protein